MKSFYRQSEGERANIGTYLLTLSVVLFSLIPGQFLAELLARNVWGFSLMYIPKSIDRNVVLLLALIPFLVAFIALILSLKYIHKREVRTIFTSRARFDWKRFGLSAILWLSVMVGLLAVAMNTGTEIEWNIHSGKLLPLVLICILVLPFQTAAEDLLFRSFIFQGLGRLNISPLLAVAVCGILFGLAHAGNPEIDIMGYQVLFYFIMTGFFLGMITHYDNGMELGMGYHFANNLFGVLILTNDWQALQTDALLIDKSLPVFGWDSILVIAILQPLLFFFFSRIYKWKKNDKV